MTSIYYVVVNSITDRTVFSLYFVGVFCQCNSVTMVNLFITSIPGSYFQAHLNIVINLISSNTKLILKCFIFC